VEGLIHRANIYRRITAAGTTQWETTPFIEGYHLRLDPVSPNQLLRETYANCTHKAIGDYRLAIDQGMRMVVTSLGPYNGKTLHIAGVHHFDAGSAGGHQTECMLVEVKLSG
jgi:hypothetical protein